MEVSIGSTRTEMRGENVKGCIELLAVCCILFRMGTPPSVIVRVTLSLSVQLSVAALNDLGYTVESYDDFPGIYYENKGVAVLYSMAWRTIEYVYLSKLDNETFALR